MEYIEGILSNRVLLVSSLAWAVAQLLKFIIYAIVNKEFSLGRLFGPGGMPSSHSSTVVALAYSTAIHSGTDSIAFAITVILALIVMHDARGVRLQAGMQAKVINKIVTSLKNKEGNLLDDIDFLKELIGHTPLQVYVGAGIGLLIAIIFA